MPKTKKKTLPENPFTPISGFECDSSGFETLVKEYFGKDDPSRGYTCKSKCLADFSFEADQQLGHDDIVEFNPTGDVDEADLAEILDGDRYEWNTSTLMEKLVADGFLPAGQYFISTC